MKSKLLCLLVGLAIGALCALVGLRQLRLRTLKPPIPVLEVNGATISMDQYVSSLKGKSGASVLAELTQQLLVTQLATREKIHLTQREETGLKTAAQSIDNTDVRDYVAAHEKSQLLLRKLILKDVSEQEMRRIYELYPDEFTQREIFVILLATEGDAKAVWQRLQEHILTFEQLATTYSLAPNTNGKVGFMSMPEICRQFGSEAAAAIAKLPANSALAPIYCNQGMMIIRVGSILDSYDKVKPAVERIVIDSRRVAFCRSLLHKAKIQSPLLDLSPGGRNRQDIVPGQPQASPVSLPTPGIKLTSTPAPGLLRPQDLGKKDPRQPAVKVLEAP